MINTEKAERWLRSWLEKNSISPVDSFQNINLLEANILDSFGFVLLVTEIQSEFKLLIDIDSLQNIEDYTFDNIIELIVNASHA